MENKELTIEEINKYKDELEKFRSYRQTMFWCSVGSFISASVMFALYIYFIFADNYLVNQICYYTGIILILAGITLAILKSALFNSRIRNRENLLNNAQVKQEQ